MGVRGAVKHKSNPKSHSPTSCMKPPSPLVSFSFPSSPSLSPSPTLPDPPPLQLPNELHRSENGQADLSHAFGTADLPASSSLSSFCPFPAANRNLLLSTTESRDICANSVHTTRPPSARIAQKAQDSNTPFPSETLESFSNIEVRFYPFPPPRHPLTYPLNTSHTTIAKRNLEKHMAKTKDRAPFRKRLLSRWRTDCDEQANKNTHENIDNSISSATQRTISQSSAKKRNRKYASAHVHEGQECSKPLCSDLPPTAFDMSDQCPSYTTADRAPVADTSEAIGATDAFEVSNGKRRAHFSGNYCSNKRRQICDKKRGRKEMHTSNSKGINDLSYGGKNAGSPRNVQAKEDGIAGTKKTSSSNVVTKRYTQAGHESLQKLRRRIEALKERRHCLEKEEFNEISKTAAELCREKMTKEQRLKLKSDIEELDACAINNMLRHISRRCRGFDVADHEEVRLQLDMLPAKLSKELQLMVMRERGQVSISASAKLHKVGNELKEAIQKYRTGLREY